MRKVRNLWLDLRIGFGVSSIIINAKACVGTILAARQAWPEPAEVLIFATSASALSIPWMSSQWHVQQCLSQAIGLERV